MVENRRYTPKRDALPEHLCQLLVKHGLSGAVLIQPSFLGSDNSYLLDTLSKYQTATSLTFKGVVVLDPDTLTDTETLQQMSELGVIGVRLNLIKQDNNFNYSRWNTLLSAVEDREWHIELHCDPASLESILPVLVRNHKKVVIDHLGLVEDTRTCVGLKTILNLPAERLWVKNSAPYRIDLSQLTLNRANHFQELIRIYSDYLGEDRLVWGSDWPFTQFENSASYEDMVKHRKQALQKAGSTH
ncbi:MAG: amidohydrolase family protein [Granulosicoccus sp.]|nr:amidohydrolase family protein [Granulosicoccus sp.]